MGRVRGGGWVGYKGGEGGVVSVQFPNNSPLLLLTCDCCPPKLHELCMAKLMEMMGLCLLHL